MVFSSYVFLFAFLPILLALYYIFPGRRTRNIILLLSSLLFYAWGEPIYVVLMIFSTLFNYAFSLLIEKTHNGPKKHLANYHLAFAMIINLGLLGFFKYYGFLLENLNLLFDLKLMAHQLPLPIGISFYTFQTMSYTIDVFNKKVAAKKDLIAFATYVTLFPQLVAGPIVRYSDVEYELDHRQENFPLFAQGIQRFFVGLGKKVILANPMGFMANEIYGSNVTEHSSLILWLAIVAYSLQIYFDFSGYSDMAIGLGKMFGFNFLENFNYPYISKSVTEFWRRWHISLSTWFRDYVYIPLGGNRCSAPRMLFNLLIVWLATGIWHGAAWNYVLWGLYYFVLLMMEKYLWGKYLKKTPQIFQHFYAVFFIMIGWLLFRIEDLSQLWQTALRMFIYHPIDWTTFVVQYKSLFYALPFLPLAILAATPIFTKIFPVTDDSKKGAWRIHIEYTLVFAIGLIAIVILAGEGFNPFIYYRF